MTFYSRNYDLFKFILDLLELLRWPLVFVVIAFIVWRGFKWYNTETSTFTCNHCGKEFTTDD